MSHIKSYRVAVSSVSVLAIIAVAVAASWALVGTGVEALDNAGSPVVAPVSTDPATGDVGAQVSDALGVEGAGGPGCSPCKQRPWCKCTYDGAPRISCDPCCYFSERLGLICFD